MHVRDMREISVPELDKYVIIDTHGGQEDVLGLVIALKLAQKYDKIILGITCTNGRRCLDDAVHDALVAQQIAGTHYPVFRGSKQSLLLQKNYPQCYNLSNNFQALDAIQIQQCTKNLVQKQNASVFIAEQIRKYSDELCLISFGPLTNFAIAFHQTQTINILSSIRINGGAVSGVGNVIGFAGAEGNFHYDPEAAHIIISNYKNVYINPIEKTLEISWKDYLTQIYENTALNKQLKKIVEVILSHQHALCGPLLTLLPVFRKTTVQKVLSVYSQVITHGSKIVGLMASNWLRLEVGQHEQQPNTKIYSTYDLTQSKKIISESLQLK